MPSFPNSIFSPASKNTGDTIQAAHVTDLDSEVVAIEQGLRNGTAPLNSSNSTFAALAVSGASTFTGAVTFNGPVTFSTTVTGISNPSTFASLQVTGGSTLNTVTAGASTLASLSVSGASTLASAVIGASTTTLALVQKYTVEFTPPEMAQYTVLDSTYAVSGLSTADLLIFQPRVAVSTNYLLSSPRCLAANELTLRWENKLLGSTFGSGESTGRGILLAFRV